MLTLRPDTDLITCGPVMNIWAFCRVMMPSSCWTMAICSKSTQTSRWLDESGRPLDLLAALKKAGQPGRVDQPIWLGRKSGPPILLRLVALRKLPAAAAEARRTAHRYAQRDPPRRRKLQAMPSVYRVLNLT